MSTLHCIKTISLSININTDDYIFAEDIDVKVEGPGKADVVSKDEKAGVTTVIYTPVSPGEYEVHIKHKGKAIHGSPFSAKISGWSLRFVSIMC